MAVPALDPVQGPDTGQAPVLVAGGGITSSKLLPRYRKMSVRIHLQFTSVHLNRKRKSTLTQSVNLSSLFLSRTGTKMAPLTSWEQTFGPPTQWIHAGMHLSVSHL